MLVRSLFAAFGLAAMWVVHVNYPWIEVSALLFLSAVSVGSIFVPDLGRVAIGTFAIFVAMAIAFLASAALSGIGLRPIVSRFEIVTVVLILAFVGVSSALLCRYAHYPFWQLLGSFGIFLVSLCLHFHAQEGRVQGLGFVLGILTAISWFAGCAVGAAIRR
jgi:hypothetical protein